MTTSDRSSNRSISRRFLETARNRSTSPSQTQWTPHQYPEGLRCLQHRDPHLLVIRILTLAGFEGAASRPILPRAEPLNNRMIERQSRRKATGRRNCCNRTPNGTPHKRSSSSTS